MYCRKNLIVLYYIWSDGSFVSEDEYSAIEYGHKGTDYVVWGFSRDIPKEEIKHKINQRF